MAREEEARGVSKLSRLCSGDEEGGGIKRGIGDEEGKKLCQFLRPLSIQTIFPGPIHISEIRR